MSSAHPLPAASTWFKSSYSGGNTTECVECTRSEVGALVRDSKRPEGPMLTVRTGAWSAFIEGVCSSRLSPVRPVL